MSRSSKAFADFFPTAPAVLKAQRRRDSSTQDSVLVSQQKTLAVSSLQAKQNLSSQRLGPESKNASTASAVQDMPDEHGPARHEVGHEASSTSSVSTVSSIFSTQQKPIRPTTTQISKGSGAPTPLTTLNSSPRTNGRPSPRQGLGDHIATEISPPSPAEHDIVRVYMDYDSDENEQPSRPTARPGKGFVKGHRIIYDPVTDRVTKSKDRRPKGAQYEAFGLDVLSTPTHVCIGPNLRYRNLTAAPQTHA